MRFGASSVFRDVDSITVGADFREHLRRALEQCSSLIAVIGPGFLLRSNTDGPDYVVEEIAGALERRLRILPVLVHGAEMPRRDQMPEAIQDLAFRQAARLRGDPDFRGDVEAVLRWLAADLERPGDGDESDRRCLVLVSGPRKGARFEIHKERTLIGRSPKCDVPLETIVASPYHAEIVTTPQGLACQDLGSTNGTYVNGERVVGRRLLHDGDLIHVGDAILQVQLGSAGDRAAAANVSQPIEGSASAQLRVTLHVARFVRTGTQCCFINVTNLAGADVELTHVWMATTPATFPETPDRPLPKRLRPQESWETWIPLSQLPAMKADEDLNRLGRARLSTGVVAESVANESVPPSGSVPGGPIETLP